MVSIPLAFILFEVAKEANVTYVILKQKIQTGNLFGDCSNGFLCSHIKSLTTILNQPEIKFYIQDSLQKVTSYITQNALSILFSIPRWFFSLLITFFVTFFLLRDGKIFIKRIERLIPIKKKHTEKIFRKMKGVTRAIIYGFFVIAIIQGLLIALTFSFANIVSPILWGIIVAILALIPFIGSTIVWVPALIIKLIELDTRSSVIILIGGIIVSSIDTFLKPKIIGNHADVHPVLIILGFLGGISVFGLIGSVIGPLILALVVTFLSIYEEGK